MTFPHPQNPNDWQAAYTRDDAYRDSGEYAKNSFKAMWIGSVIVSCCLFVLLLGFDMVGAFPISLKVALFIILVLVVFMMFAAIQSFAIRFAADFLREFHKFPGDMNAAQLINNRLYGRLKLPPPLNMLIRFNYLLVKDGEIAKADHWPAWSARNLGGPLLLIIFDGNALYLERGNRFSRVVGPGDPSPFLEWYETIKYVVDLRPRIHVGEVTAWTKDGIKVEFKIRMECRIGNPREKDPDSRLIYPYDPLAVKQAVERFAVSWPDRLKGQPHVFNLVDTAWGQVTGIIPNYIGGRMLDDLFIADRNGGQILSPTAIQELFVGLNQSTNSFGVYVTDFQVLEVKMPPEVENALKELWMAEKHSVATIVNGDAKAFSIRTREKARADAQYDLIVAIADGLEKSRNGQFTEPLLLSLSRVLDESLQEPLMRAYLASQTVETLEQLRKMLDQSTKSSEPPHAVE